LCGCKFSFLWNLPRSAMAGPYPGFKSSLVWLSLCNCQTTSRVAVAFYIHTRNG
jgi:hypothetical protein